MTDISHMPGPVRHALPNQRDPQPDSRLWQSARQLEAAFLAEMLTAAGAGQVPTGFGGGIGEEQFASFLVHAQAERIAERGGIGLAEMILRTTLSGQTSGTEPSQ